jgi:hypothetical protein
MARTRAFPSPPSIIIKKQAKSKQKKLKAPPQPFPLWNCNQDILNAILDFVSIEEVLRLYLSGNSKLREALESRVKSTGWSHAWNRQFQPQSASTTFSWGVFPMIQNFVSLKSLLIEPTPAAMRFTDLANLPTSLTLLKLLVVDHNPHSTESKFFEVKNSAFYSDLEVDFAKAVEEAPSKARHKSSKKPASNTKPHSFSIFKRLESLCSLIITGTSASGGTGTALFENLPPRLEKLVFQVRGNWSTASTEAFSKIPRTLTHLDVLGLQLNHGDLAHLPSSLITLSLASMAMNQLKMAFNIVPLAELSQRAAGMEEEEEEPEFEDLNLAELYVLITGSGPENAKHQTIDSVKKEVSLRKHVVLEKLASQLPPHLLALSLHGSLLSRSSFLGGLPTTLTSLTIDSSDVLEDTVLRKHLPKLSSLLVLVLGEQCHPTDPLLAALPRSLTHLSLMEDDSLGGVFDSSPLTWTLLPQGLTRLDWRCGIELDDLFMEQLPRTLTHLEMGWTEVSGLWLKSMPPSLTFFQCACAWHDIDAISLPRALRTLDVHLHGEVSTQFIAGLPRNLTHLSLGNWSTVRGNFSSALPRTLSRCAIFTVLLNDKIVDLPGDADELEDSKFRTEEEQCEARIRHFCKSLPEGLQLKCWFNYCKKTVRTSPYLHSLNGWYKPDTSHRPPPNAPRARGEIRFF